MSFNIHFQLEELDKIIPWGDEKKSLHWYGLTDGLLWITAGKDTVFEYSQYAKEFWNCPEHDYNDYQLARFLQDFSGTFPFICESVPKVIYDNIENFMYLTNQWKLIHEDDPDDVFELWYDEEFNPLVEWFYQQNAFDSMHLTGGYEIGCFRFEDKIKFWWDNDNRLLENNLPIWTSQKGCYEMPYADFVKEVQRFYDAFFMKMNEQVKSAVQKDWKEVCVDKQELLKSHRLNREVFQQKIDALSRPPAHPRDWNQILSLWQKCLDELQKN